MKFQMAAVWILTTGCAVLVTGCQTPTKGQEPSSLCPGKMTIGEAAAVLAQQRAALVPLRTTARCVIRLRDIENKVRSESVDGQVWFLPSDRLLFTGDKVGKEVRFGANEEEFWLRVKPELDTYWYGTRQQAQVCSSALPINPANLTEAVGMVEVDARWELFHRDGFDWLTLREDGRPVKRVYVDACDYRVARIEYFDRIGTVTSATELSDYADLGDGLLLPTRIRLTTFFQGREDSSAELKLGQVRRVEPTDKQRQGLFTRPGRDGYGTVLRLDKDCNFVEEN